MIGRELHPARDRSSDWTVTSRKTLLSFRGHLDQDYLETFTSHLEHDDEIASAEQRRRVTNVMIELGQNIIKHGVPTSKSDDASAARPALEVARDSRGFTSKPKALRVSKMRRRCGKRSSGCETSHSSNLKTSSPLSSGSTGESA
jgi:hypothetical protein